LSRKKSTNDRKKPAFLTGAIWFTDPVYGALMKYEGKRADTGSVQPYQKEAIYRIDAQSGKIDKVTD